MTVANPILDRMRAGETALGMTLRLVRSPGMARVVKASGHHFLRIDNQHGLFDLETIADITQASMALGLGVVVRVRDVTDPVVGPLLDAGVSGVVFPNVDTPDQARRAADAAKFPPVGTRSYGGGYPQLDYRPAPVGETMEELNRATLVVCMVESETALENVDAIAAVDGVDVVHLGMSDFLISKGLPGRYRDPILAEALDRTIEAASSRGKFAGCGGAPSIEHQADAIRRGVRFLTTRADVNFLISAAETWLEGLGREQS